ncbi:MAG: hypothetical protein GX621_09090 [Pirellulaceae bacterium]|nr:hypothetical protein [Pirellulaceae bacterium]
MIQENEIVMLVLTMGVGAFLLADRVLMRRIPSFRLLAAGFGFLVGAFVFTVVEGFFLYNIFNIFNLLEHASYAVGALCVAFWCRRVFGGGGARANGEQTRGNGGDARCG